MPEATTLPSTSQDHRDLSQIIEALLFVATDPLSETKLARAAGAKTTDVKIALDILEKRLRHGIRLSKLAGHYQLVTAPMATTAINAFLGAETKAELSRPALETLAIIAYRGPITRGQVEQIRGVASDTLIRNLIGRGLVTDAGRSTEPGRPVLYTITPAFLQHFGLTSPADLPPLPEDPEGTIT